VIRPVLALRGAGLIAREVVRSGVGTRLRGADVPLRASDVTPAWFTEQVGLEHGSIRSVRVVSETSGTAARALLDIEFKRATDFPSRVFLKLMPTSYGQRMLMNVTGLGRREVLFYNAVAPGLSIRVPECYAARFDPRTGRNAMILEDLTAQAVFRDVRSSVSPHEAEAVVDSLADLHVSTWASERLEKDLAPLTPLRDGSPAVRMLGVALMKRLLENPKAASAIIPAEVKRSSHIVYDNADEIDAFWASQTRTIAHGDPHLGNLFFESATPGFVDWQVAMIAPGIRDVAYFTISALDPPVAREMERDLVRRYATRLAAAGVSPLPAEDELWTHYRAIVAEFYTAAIATAGAGERMQDVEVGLAGATRAVAAVQALDTFDVLADLVGITI
jgi:aminoglycoside/choline kinase family phosphotransferase